MDLNEVYRNSGLGKWFHGESANKTPGWDRYNSEGKMVGECGDADKGEAYSACLSKQKAQKLGKEGIASFVKRKRAAQSEAGRGEKGAGGKGQKPINVDTGASKMDECVECNEELELINEGKNKPNDPEKWSACKSAAKSKFDVYPSAYANAWAAKCYKKKGGTWRSLNEGKNFSTEFVAQFDGSNPTNSKISANMGYNFISRFGNKDTNVNKYMAELEQGRASAKHVNTSELPSYDDASLERTVDVSGSDLGQQATRTLQGTMLAQQRQEADAIQNDRESPLSLDNPRFGAPKSADRAAAKRTLAATIQFKDYLNRAGEENRNVAPTSNLPPNAKETSRAIGDKAAMADITGKTLMPVSTSKEELNSMLDSYKKSVEGETTTSPETKAATLKRIEGYRNDPAAEERLRLSKNNSVESVSTAVTEELKSYTKQNVLFSLFENNKMKGGPGKTSQRPKSWNKGTKSGSEKRKMREEGKREVRDMNEGIDDFFSTNANGVTRGLDRNYGVEHEDDVTHPYDMVHSTHFEPVDWQDRSKGIKAREGSPVATHGIPVHLLDTGTLLPKPEAEAEFAQHPNAMKYLRDVKRSHWDSYSWAAGAARKGLKGARRAAALYTQMGISAKSLMERIRTGQVSPPQTGDVSEQTIETRLRNALLEGFENREQQREYAPHELGIPDDVDSDEEKEKALADFHAQRTHVSPEEEAQMHEIFAKHFRGIQDRGEHAKTFPKLTKWEAYTTAQKELDAVLRGRVTELSRPDYPEEAMSHQDRLTRIHQLHNLSREAEQIAYKTYMS